MNSKFSRGRFLARTAAPAVIAGSGLAPRFAEAQSPANGAATRGPAPMPVSLRVNGVQHTLEIEPRVTLLDALRERLGLTGSKKGCDHGQCGACTVLVDGVRVNGCLTLAIATEGREITTVEGLARGEALHPVQQAFIERDAFQCGYCTSGQICSAVGLIREGRARDASEIREQMSGNICRCGAYTNIVAAVQDAAKHPDGGRV